MNKYLLVFVVLLILLFGGLLIKMAWFPVYTDIKSVDMAYGVVDEVLDANNAIYNYEWFKQQEADIRKCLANEEIAQDEYYAYIGTLSDNSSEWSRFQEQEEASLRNSLYALRMITNNAIEDYNAKASMVNRNIFKDNLPSNISRAFYAGYQLTK